MLLNSPPQKTLCALLLIACVHGRPQGDKDAKVLTSEYKQEIPGSYRYKYETSNGIEHSEIGEMQQTNLNQKSLSKKGYFSYRGLDNILYTITYVADDKGFRPTTHIGGPVDPVQSSYTTVLPSDKNALGSDDEDDDDDRIGSTLIISLGGGGVG
ncbi:PREDICTED: endocuticle structural glycoprotein SgAbd-5-like [Nicrophorus vespilloides]|uniref:Endocuticle structural glycoprotein SgAbd-5-like n=1 Tax=Nicrophorus vespilloides TaxID=110193 RepID=A0ABM1NFX9_NICVS|nr:PREDICTED: endocuticle structural glycoprotein SgAbd-5-like [Nicrophorus vespilloides]